MEPMSQTARWRGLVPGLPQLAGDTPKPVPASGAAEEEAGHKASPPLGAGQMRPRGSSQLPAPSQPMEPIHLGKLSLNSGARDKGHSLLESHFWDTEKASLLLF